MLDISKLSDRYDIRRLDDTDVGLIFELCHENTLFYQYCGASRPV